MTKEEKRKEWEKGLVEKMTISPSMWTTLVVLEEAEKGADPFKFHCHRYFCMSGDTWEVSVDHRDANFDAVLRWIEKEVRASEPT